MAKKDKVKPTHYPFIPFHFLRCAQLLSAVVVSIIMAYFVWWLRHDNRSTPWTFILLFVVSLLTMVFLSMTIVLHCCCGLNPRLNLALNTGLLCIWTVGFALLLWYSRGTLSHVCNTANWHDSTGIMICRIYKALFAFSLLGFVSTLCAALLDIYVFRRATARGKYDQMHNPDQKGGLPYDGNNHSAIALDGHFSQQKPSKRSSARGGQGYEVPEEQFAYGDTAYHGVHGHA